MKVNGSRPVKALHSGLIPLRGCGLVEAGWPPAHTLSSLIDSGPLPSTPQGAPPQKRLFRFQAVAAAAATAVTLSRPLPRFPQGCSLGLRRWSGLAVSRAAFRPAALSMLTTHRTFQSVWLLGLTGEARHGSGRACKARLQMRRWHFFP